MTRPATALLVLMTTVLVTGGCGSSSSTNVTAPSTARCQPALAPSPSSYGSAGGSGTLTVTVARDCSWSATSDASWIAITSAIEGQGDGTLGFRVSPNDVPVGRRGGITVSGVRVELSQEAAACAYQVSTFRDPIGADGGERAIDVRTHTACDWRAASNVPWATVSPVSGRGDGTVRVTVLPNGAALRTGELSIATQRISVTQLSPSLPPPPPAPAPTPAPAPSPTPAPTPTPEPVPTPVEQVRLEGKVLGLSGTCPTLTFLVDGTTVYTTADTKFDLKCRDVKNGSKVRVEGRKFSDGTVFAEEVKKV